MTDPRQVLRHWIDDSADVAIQPVARGGFSGARLWQVEHQTNVFALKQWPAGRMRPERLKTIHALQRRLAACKLPVSAPLPGLVGSTIASAEETFWELAPWMPGVADYWSNPRPVKLEAALRTLAELHVSAARIPFEMPAQGRLMPTDHGLRNRIARLETLCDQELQQLDEMVQKLPPGTAKEQADETLGLLRKVAPGQVSESLKWNVLQIPIHWRIGDVWHDHVLFTGDKVTGIVDFGGAVVGCPAADIARLLGSLVADDREAWQKGLRAYQSVRAMSPIEMNAVDFFDTSGTVLSATNWIHWLYGAPAALDPLVDRTAAQARLDRLIVRLRVLATAGTG